MRLGQLAKQLEVKPREILDFINKNKGLDLEMNLIEKYFYYDPNQNLIYPEEQILHNKDK